MLLKTMFLISLRNRQLYRVRLRELNFIHVNLLYFAQRSKAIYNRLWISTFFVVFSRLPAFLSFLMGSGSYKNSYRKLRVYSFRSQNLVNMCWPFSQHIDTLSNCVFAKCPWLVFGKNVVLIFTCGYVPKHDYRSLYCSKWKL